MANVNNPHGLKPLGRREGGGAPELRHYPKVSGYAAAIFQWDPVSYNTTGTGSPGLVGPASGITPGTTFYQGVVHGAAVGDNSPLTSTPWYTASTAASLLVEISPDSLFDIQGDGTGTGLASDATTINKYGNLNVASVAGGGVTRMNSGVQLVESTVATTATFDMKILQLLSAVDNAYGVNARVEVKFNRHLFNTGIVASQT